jgi:hypothetical protein
MRAGNGGDHRPRRGSPGGCRVRYPFGIELDNRGRTGRLRPAPHEPVRDPDHLGLVDDLVAEALVEGHVLGLVRLEIPDGARLVQTAAVLDHDPRADPLPLEVGVDRERTQVRVRLRGIVVGPDLEPARDADERSGAERHQRRQDAELLAEARLTAAGWSHAGDPDDHALAPRLERRLGGRDAKQAAEHALEAATPLLRIVAEGRPVERVVAHASGEHPHRGCAIARPQIPDHDLSRCRRAHGPIVASPAADLPLGPPTLRSGR